MSEVSRAEIAKAITEQIGKIVQSSTITAGIARWNNAETEDANLSYITYNDKECRYVPKNALVTGLSAGENVLVHNYPGIGLVIMCRIVGNTTIPAA